MAQWSKLQGEISPRGVSGTTRVMVLPHPWFEPGLGSKKEKDHPEDGPFLFLLRKIDVNNTLHRTDNRLVNYVCISSFRADTSACKRPRMLSHSPRCGCYLRWQMKGVTVWRSGLQQARFNRDCVGPRKLIDCLFEPGVTTESAC